MALHSGPSIDSEGKEKPASETNFRGSLSSWACRLVLNLEKVRD